MPDTLMVKYGSKYGTGERSKTKWDEPDAVFGAAKPFSKVETGSSFFSTYGYTNRKKDYVAEKVRDYYYDGDAKSQGHSVRFRQRTDGEEDGAEAKPEPTEEKKEKRKKKKSKEPEEVKEAKASTEEHSEASGGAPETEGEAAPAAEDEVLDEKEKKRLEKKKRKAEREAAAKAAMEAELEALAIAELELAKLEQDSAKPGAEGAAADAAAPEAAAAEPAAEEAAAAPAEACESAAEPVAPVAECVSSDLLDPPVSSSLTSVQQEQQSSDTLEQEASAPGPAPASEDAVVPAEENGGEQIAA